MISLNSLYLSPVKTHHDLFLNVATDLHKYKVIVHFVLLRARISSVQNAQLVHLIAKWYNPVN